MSSTTRRRRRVSRESERGPLAIAAAIPQGSIRVRHGSTWLTLVRQAVERECVRRDHADNVLRVAQLLLTRADATRTTRPGWHALAEGAGIARATVHRILCRLARWGLLGTVATGRRGCFAPGGRYSRRYVAKVPAQNFDGDPKNEAAVYVLCEPAPPRNPNSRNDSAPAVDTSETPPPSGLEYSPARTREAAPQTRTAPLRGTESLSAAQARRRDPVLRHREGHWFPTGETTGGKDAALRAAHELRVRLPVLRGISSQHVRSVLRPFFAAGWTVGDVILAIDIRPDGRRWPHDGGHSVENVGAWLAYRLRPWTSDGDPHRSPSQRRAAERSEAAAARRARAEQEAGSIPASSEFVEALLAPLRAAGILAPRRRGVSGPA